MPFSTIMIHKKSGTPDDGKVNALEKVICNVAHDYDVEIIDEHDSDSTFKELANILHIALGGDGTVLKAAKCAQEYGAYVLGFNLGTLGFLAEFKPSDICDVLECLFDESLSHYKIEHRSMLLARKKISLNDCHDASIPLGTAMNDIVISSKYSDTLMSYQLHVGETGQTKDNAGLHTANGLIVSTPTGSTGYSLNVGGTLMSPRVRAMQIVPIAAMTMTSRPIIVDEKSSTKVKVYPVKSGLSNPIQIKGDGIVLDEFDATDETNLSIRMCSNTVKFVHSDSWNFYNVLSDKLNWNK